jgi:hypothetical protein
LAEEFQGFATKPKAERRALVKRYVWRAQVDKDLNLKGLHFKIQAVNLMLRTDTDSSPLPT